MNRACFAAATAVALGLTGFGVVRAPAAPVTQALDALVLELQTRREYDFGGTLTPALKKQKKAVLKSLSLILDRESTTFIDDMKTFSLVAKVLEGAYPAEMTMGSGDPLRLAAEAPVTDIDLTMAYSSDLGGLQYTLYRLAPSPAAAKAAKLLKAAQAADALPNPGNSLAVFSRNRAKSWKAAQKGFAIAQAATQLPPPSMTFTADGVAYAANGVTTYTDVSWTYHAMTKRIDVSCTYIDYTTNDTRVVFLSGPLVAGSGTVAVDDGRFETHSLSNGDDIFPATGGTVTIGTLDLPHHSFSGTFDMPVSGSKAFDVTGSFTATWHLVVEAD